VKKKATINTSEGSARLL